ncbi:MAG: hypothetical protein ACFFAT_09720 [Promethearchaeota archaeon]
MEQFLVLELTFLILTTVIWFILTITLQLSAKSKQFPLLFYLRLATWSLTLYFLTKIISILLNNEQFARIHFLLMFPYTFFFILFVNNIIRESYYSIGLVVSCCLGFSLIFLGIQPNAVIFVEGLVIEKYVPFGLFNIVQIIFWYLFLGYFFYWGYKTWSGSPFYLKKKAFISLIGNIILVFRGGLLYLFYYIDTIFTILFYILNLIGLLIVTIIISTNFKLLHILPYHVYKISIRDHKGNSLYDHDWSDLNISETIFTGFLNAIQIMSEEVMNIGGIVDINLNEGIVFINRSEYIIVGLVASKASKLLRDCVVNFSNDFENKFKRLLKKSCTDKEKYRSAYELINKYFSNVPYHLIKDKDQVLTLSCNFKKIPKQIENKLKTIFSDKDEYESILNELARLPISTLDEFSDLYDEFKDEIDLIEMKESKEIEDKRIEK